MSTRIRIAGQENGLRPWNYSGTVRRPAVAWGDSDACTGGAVDLSELHKLEAKKDLATIAGLPAPDESEFVGLGSNELCEMGELFARWWFSLLFDDISDAAEIPEAINQALVTASAYYITALRHLPESAVQNPQRDLPGFRAYAGMDWGRIGFMRDELCWAREPTMYFFFSLVRLHTLRLWREDPSFPRLLRIECEAVAHGAAQTTFDEFLRSLDLGSRSQQLFLCSLLGHLLFLMHRVYEQREFGQGLGQETVRIAGPFTAMRLDELARLAARDTDLARRYHPRPIEAVFEEQLSLVFQSLGFYVVRACLCDRSVDLVCVSPDPREHSTVLVEAKTSAGPYKLPVDDERALLEYLEVTRRALTTLPPVRLVLLVGHKPARSLEPRLRRLETQGGLPVRFCSAGDIADLRASVPAAPLRALVDRLRRGPAILPPGWAREVAQICLDEERAHVELVRTMTGVMRPDPGGPLHER